MASPLRTTQALLLSAALGLGCTTPRPSAEASVPAPQAGPTTDPAETEAAVADFKNAADFLAGQKIFTFSADVSFDVQQADGQRLEFGGTRDAIVRRPDRLRVDAVKRGGESTTLLFDGTTLAIDLPAHAAYVQVERPGSTDAVLDYIVEALETPIPLEDFVSDNYAEDALPGILEGRFVDVEQLDGRWCEHLAYRMQHVDFQLWIEEGERPLPCRLVIVYKTSPGQPKFAARFRDWDLSPKTPDTLFEFQPREGAERLQVHAPPHHHPEQEKTP